MSQTLIAGIGGFLLGSLPTGFLLVAALGRGDIRRVGSGNIGATNVGRVLGRTGWTITLLLDAAKGAGAVLAAGALLAAQPAVLAAAGFGAIAGHCFTPWLAFRGGKGVATMLGTYLVLAPAATLATMAVFGLIARTTRIVSLASLAAAVVLPLAVWAFGAAAPVVVAAAATMLLVFYRHRPNLARLAAGTEARIGDRIA